MITTAGHRARSPLLMAGRAAAHPVRSGVNVTRRRGLLGLWSPAIGVRRTGAKVTTTRHLRAPSVARGIHRRGDLRRGRYLSGIGQVAQHG